MTPLELSKKKCQPCASGAKALKPELAKALAEQVPLWALGVSDPRISRHFEFKDFKRAMKFVNKVAAVAEEEGHHPDIHVHYNRVELVLWTHDVGGLSENDFILAAKIDLLKV